VAPVTADTNVYISALQFGGTPLRFLELARAGVFRLAVSPPILVEVRRVLSEKFAWPERDITTALSDLDECATMVHPTQSLAVVVDDPDDDRILECAVAAGSSYLVSGDNHLLRLGGYEGIRVLRVAEFLAILRTE
jgi:putative PIN family toxin of toxin-antitoxin system